MRVNGVAGCLAAVLLCGSLLGAAGQGHRSKPDSGRGPEATVLRLENEWTKAVIRHDMRAMAATLADGMVYTENDQTTDKKLLLRDLAASKEKTTVARNEGMKAHTFGGTIVVTGDLIVEGTGPDGKFDRRYRFTDVWVNRNGRWQIVAAQDYLKPAQ